MLFIFLRCKLSFITGLQLKSERQGMHTTVPRRGDNSILFCFAFFKKGSSCIAFTTGLSWLIMNMISIDAYASNAILMPVLKACCIPVLQNLFLKLDCLDTQQDYGLPKE